MRLRLRKNNQIFPRTCLLYVLFEVIISRTARWFDTYFKPSFFSFSIEFFKIYINISNFVGGHPQQKIKFKSITYGPTLILFTLHSNGHCYFIVGHPSYKKEFLSTPDILAGIKIYIILRRFDHKDSFISKIKIYYRMSYFI